MPKRLQPNPSVSRRKTRYETTTEISSNLRTRLVLLFGETEKLALSQMPGTTLPQQMLQYGIVGRSINYVEGACLPLITLQNIQLHIQVTKKQRGQR